MTEVQVKVKVAEQELEIHCVCGNQFIVAGEIPHATVCDQCKQEIDLRIPRKLLKA